MNTNSISFNSVVYILYLFPKEILDYKTYLISHLHEILLYFIIADSRSMVTKILKFFVFWLYYLKL